MGMLTESFIAVNFKDGALWLAVAAVVAHEVLCRYLMIWECENRRLTVLLGSSKRAGYMICVAVFLIGLVRFFLVTSALESQPRWMFFHENTFLVLGHLINLAGVALLIACATSKGVFRFLICVHFDVFEEQVYCETFPYSIFEDPVSVATGLMTFGISFLNASQAGMILTMLTGLFSSYGLAQFLSPRMTR